VLTVEEHKEKVEPAHDAFQAPPADVVNESLKAELAETGANAPIGQEKEKARERKEEEERKAKEVLENTVGPLLPSDLAKVAEEREAKKADSSSSSSLAAGEGVQEKEVVEKGTEPAMATTTTTTEIDLTAVEPAVPKAQEEEVKIQTAPHEKEV